MLEYRQWNFFFDCSHHRCPFLLSCSQVVFDGKWLTNSWKRQALMGGSHVRKIVVATIKVKVVCTIISNMSAASIRSLSAIIVGKALLVIVICEDTCLSICQVLWKRRLKMIIAILYGFITLIPNNHNQAKLLKILLYYKGFKSFEYAFTHQKC